MPSLVTMRLHELRCIAESDGSGHSEPYLWVTYFAVDGRNIFRPEPVTTVTPVYDAFRQEVPNNVVAGQVINVPSFLANCSLEIDPGPQNFQMAGIAVVLLEEDETPDSAIRAGRNAYLTEMHNQLNKLIRERVASLNTGPIQPQEVDAMKGAIESAAKSAIKSHLSWWQKLTGDQDDFIGFTYAAFIGSEISARYFDFPELTDGHGNRYILSGSLFVGPVPGPVVDRCATQRQAVRAKKDQIQALHNLKSILQHQLQTASPQAKAAIIQQITQVGAQITQAESELPALEAALQACVGRTFPDHGIPPVVVDRPVER